MLVICYIAQKVSGGASGGLCEMNKSDGQPRIQEVS